MSGSIYSLKVQTANELKKLKNIVDNLENKTQQPIILSYAKSRGNVAEFNAAAGSGTNGASNYVQILNLVQPNTDIILSENDYITIKGTDFEFSFYEIYTILYQNSTISFGSLYLNSSSEAGVTSASTITFPVVSSNGVFEGATEVIVQYTDNQYKSRIITINF